MSEEIQLINGNENFGFYPEKKILGSGRSSNVFRGKYNERDVAVKRIVIGSNRNLSLREINNLRVLEQHAHIVEFFYSDEEDKFRYLAFELCHADLRQYVLPESEYRANGGLVLTDESDQIKVILQLTEALQFIHSKELIHRDINPANTLVSSNQFSVIMKWADFGHSEQINNDSAFALMCGPRGTKNWLAPENIKYFNNMESTLRKSDIFSAGCVFFFFLTQGVHPYGDENEEYNLKQNIKQRNMENRNRLNGGHRARPTVLQMMEDRLGLEEVIDRLTEALSNP